MNKANECTCPSGDGSLVHPCPAHPAPVEQAGGDERDFQAKGAQEVPSPVSKEYDRHLIGLLRKGEALPGHQEEAADEIERLRDWNDHLNNTVLPNILNPNFLMLMKGGERLLDLCTKDGKFIGVSLNDMKDVFDWMVTHARIAPDHAALAQPSPVLPPFAEKVLAKLRRFYDCAEDFESGGVDIGRHWLDLLTQLGLLNRVQRSPALWEISQHGEDLLEAPVAQAQHSVPAYVSYTTRPAESLAGIALRQLKDESRWVEIRDINAYAFPDMQSHSYYPAGTVIKLPAAAPGKEGV
ncbi:TPA: LysM peptidoglycan-binding domain-containing protein [Pseudomonas aeruginosa]|uniref:LysM peptidoglycan-binding domain-containing protein n=1 Tax=Pseudomonas aeruginosa TaxID=287 RepID=UPI003D0391F5